MIDSIGNVLWTFPNQTVPYVFGVSHILKPLSHTGAKMWLLDTPDCCNLIFIVSIFIQV